MHTKGIKELPAQVLAYIRERGLLRAGERVCVAVSGGADSVALLRLLLELRGALGVVLTVAHFHHGIRGAEADADERFVGELAAAHDLEFHRGSGDAPGLANSQRVSLETAARRLRYAYLHQLVNAGVADKIATGHTRDDQAETVLMKLLRGAGARGLAGIAPHHGAVVRPLLGIRREELRAYLEEIGQSWREDASNLDVAHTRNRVRRDLLPLLERDYNPAIVETLAGTAEIAAAEEAYWEELLASLLTQHLIATEAEVVLRGIGPLPVAVQRRLVRAAVERLGLALDFSHVEQVLRIATGAERRHGLPQGWEASRHGEEIRIARSAGTDPQPYRYRLKVPGEVEIAETGRRFRATLLNPEQQRGYNPAELLDAAVIGEELLVRNWAPGDRFWPTHRKAPKKVKELLQERKVTAAERQHWPVAVRGERIVWMRGFGAAEDTRAPQGAPAAVVIEEVSHS